MTKFLANIGALFILVVLILLGFVLKDWVKYGGKNG